MRRLIIAIFLICPSLALSAQEQVAVRNNRHLLEKAWESVDKDLIKPGGDWFPYPDYSDRAGWDALFGTSKKYVISNAEKYLKYEWKLIKATDYLALERTGNRKQQEDPDVANKKVLARLVLGELAEGKGRFIDQIVNCLWMQADRASWVAANHQRRQISGRALPDPRDMLVDLVSQQWALVTSIALHFFRDEFDKIDPVISYRIEESLERNIFEPYLDDAKNPEHKWIGFNLKDGDKVNNWNPWTNANVLLAFLLVEKDNDTLHRAVERILKSTDFYLDTNPLDGGCDEGSAYWGHAVGCLYDLLRIINDATRGTFGCFDDPQVRAMAFYKSRAYLGDGWTSNFGDGSARAQTLYELVYRYGKDCGLEELVDYAIYVSSFEKEFGHPEPYLNDIYRCLESLRYARQFAQDCSDALYRADGDMEVMRRMMRSSVPQFTWYEQTQHCFFNNGNGWFLASKAAHNNEMHNHNDVGSCILVCDDIPVLVDAGMITYTRDTFGPNRYNVWNTQSQWHNLPSINGVQQHAGSEYRGTDVSFNEKQRTFSVNIATAYPEEAECNRWIRTYSLGKSSLSINDSFSLKGRFSPDVVNFLVWGKVYLPGDSIGSRKVGKGKIMVETKSYAGERSCVTTLSFPESLEPSYEYMKTTDKAVTAVWGESLCRIMLTSAADAPVEGTYTFEINVK